MFDNTVEENSGIFSLFRMRWCHQQGHAGNKTLHQQNPPVLNWRCWLTQVDLCNGCTTVWYLILTAQKNKTQRICQWLGLDPLSFCSHPLIGMAAMHAGYGQLHTHTHTFNGPFSGTTQVSRYQKGKTSLDFTEWQWHQLGHMQVRTSLQAENHTSNPPLFFTGQMPFLPPNQQHQSTEGTDTDNYSKIQIQLRQ